MIKKLYNLETYPSVAQRNSGVTGRRKARGDEGAIMQGNFGLASWAWSFQNS